VDDQTSEMAMTIWTNFSKTGDPGITGFFCPAYTMADDAYVEIDSTMTVKTGLSNGW
jgi:hypothetical protein